MARLGRSWILSLSLLLGLAPAPQLQAALQATVAAESEDGPQVLWKGSEATVYRMRAGKLETSKRRGDFDLVLPGLASVPLRIGPRPPAPPTAKFPAAPRILAVSDVHGRFDTLLALLRAQKVVDGAMRWRFGKGHLVILGDVMDRGPQVVEAYWFLRALGDAALRAGGRVHVLLGNHEAMVLAGDVRYTNPKYLHPREGWPSVAEQFGPDSELGRWLRARPTLLKLGPFLFVHGGLSPEWMARGQGLEAMNAEIRRSLGPGPRPEAQKSTGPLWYRGLLPEGGRPQATDEEIQGILDAFGARALIVGHTTLERIGVFHGGRVFGIDAGIKDGRSGEAWLWSEGRAWRARADGGREALQP